MKAREALAEMDYHNNLSDGFECADNLEDDAGLSNVFSAVRPP